MLSSQFRNGIVLYQHCTGLDWYNITGLAGCSRKHVELDFMLLTYNSLTQKVICVQSISNALNCDCFLSREKVGAVVKLKVIRQPFLDFKGPRAPCGRGLSSYNLGKQL